VFARNSKLRVLVTPAKQKEAEGALWVYSVEKLGFRGR